MENSRFGQYRLGNRERHSIIAGCSVIVAGLVMLALLAFRGDESVGGDRLLAEVVPSSVGADAESEAPGRGMQRSDGAVAVFSDGVSTTALVVPAATRTTETTPPTDPPDSTTTLTTASTTTETSAPDPTDPDPDPTVTRPTTSLPDPTITLPTITLPDPSITRPTKPLPTTLPPTTRTVPTWITIPIPPVPEPEPGPGPIPLPTVRPETDGNRR